MLGTGLTSKLLTRAAPGAEQEGAQEGQGAGGRCPSTLSRALSYRRSRGTLHPGCPLTDLPSRHHLSVLPQPVRPRKSRTIPFLSGSSHTESAAIRPRGFQAAFSENDCAVPGGPPEGHTAAQTNLPPCAAGLVILLALAGLGVPRWSEPSSSASFQFPIYSSEFLSSVFFSVLHCRCC